MNVDILISFLIRNDIPLDAEIMTDSGWSNRKITRDC